MKAVLDNDIIVHVTEKGDTEIGSLPKGVGLERLRFNGTEVVDLADLTEIWVENRGGVLILHAIEVPNSQKISMTYADRKRLINESGTIRLRTQEEMNAEQAAQESRANDIRVLKTDVVDMIDNFDYAKVNQHIDNVFGSLTTEQKASLKKLYKVVLFLAKKGLQ